MVLMFYFHKSQEKKNGGLYFLVSWMRFFLKISIISSGYLREKAKIFSLFMRLAIWLLQLKTIFNTMSFCFNCKV